MICLSKHKHIELLEVEEGILLRPVFDPIKEVRGFLKDKKIRGLDS